MSQNEIHIGDKGTVLRATIKDSGTAIDISSASSLYFIFKKPGGTAFTVTASYVNAGTDGSIQYTIPTTTTLDEAGKWQLQAKIEFSSTQFHSDIYEFTVFKNLA